MMRVLVVLSTTFVVVGCASITDRSDRLADRVGHAVHDYCEDVSSEARTALRARANEAAAPHAVEVACDE